MLCHYCDCELIETYPSPKRGKGRKVLDGRYRVPKNTLTWDHRVPIIRGGCECLSNQVPCCLSCNSKKNDKTDLEYFELLGRQPKRFVSRHDEIHPWMKA